MKKVYGDVWDLASPIISQKFLAPVPLRAPTPGKKLFLKVVALAQLYNITQPHMSHMTMARTIRQLFLASSSCRINRLWYFLHIGGYKLPAGDGCTDTIICFASFGATISPLKQSADISPGSIFSSRIDSTGS
jgi:hypothetical protein